MPNAMPDATPKTKPRTTPDATPDATPDVRDATFRLLRELGLTTVFGNPGSTEENFLMDFPEDFRYVLALQEASVVAIADGYAQATGKPALVNIHTVAGTGNAMCSIMTAYQNKTPLLITTGNQTRDMQLMEAWLTNTDGTVMPRPWVKWAYQPVRAGDVPAAFMRAYAAAAQPPHGPVYLTLPLDDWARPADGAAVVRTVSARTAPDPDRLRQLADALRASRTPALVLGGGVDRAGGWDDGVRLAEALGAAVYAPPANERTAFPEDHALYQGALPFAIGPLADKLKGHDVVVVVGAPVFRYYPYVPGDYLPAGTALWHVTDDAEEAARAPVGESVLGDAALALRGLHDLLKDAGPARPAPAAAAKPPVPNDPPSDGAAPLSADALFAALAAERPARAVLVEESPSNLAALHARWKVTESMGFFTFASGALGWGLPAAVGVALAERDTGRNRPVFAVIGDGSLQYSIQALWTAAQHRLPLVVVVPNNAEYAILKSFAKQEQTPGVPGLDVPGLDLGKLAEGYGCTAVRATTADEVRAAVRAALGRDGPTLLDVPIGREVPALL